MRRALAPVAILAMVVLAPTPARAISWGGNVGLDYGRDDRWDVGAARATTPRLDVNLNLRLSSYVQSPDVLTWSASGGYRRLDTTYPGEQRSRRDGLSYEVRTTLLPNLRSPVSLSANASRTTEGASSGSTPAGNVTTDTMGATFRLSPSGRPGLSAAYTRAETLVETPFAEQQGQLLSSLSVTARQAVAAFTFGGTYRGDFSEGTFDTLDYAQHSVDLDAAAKLTSTYGVRVSDYFFRREARNDSPYNPTQELNSFAARLSQPPELAGARHAWKYTYAHGIQAMPGGSENERLAHGLEHQYDERLSAEWSVGNATGVTYSDVRVGDAPERTYGGSLSPSVRWERLTRRGDLVRLGGGPTVALLHSAGDVTGGYGASASAAWQGMLGEVSAQGSYNGAFASNVGTRGWSLSHDLTASGNGALGTGKLTGMVSVAAQQRHAGPFGGAATRSVSATATYAWARHSAMLVLGVEDGVANAVRDPVSGDGLFLTPGYDAHRRWMIAMVQTGLTRRMWLSSTVRATSVDMPDRPSSSDAQATAKLSYAIGALAFSVEDTYTIAQAPAGTMRYNQFLARLSRAFGRR